MSDRIFIEGIKFHGYHGLTRMEREVGCRLSVDVSLDLDLHKSGCSDSVADTLDYRTVHRRVVEIGRASSHKLLESYAVSLLNALFDEFALDQVTVRVRKETPVLDGIVDSVGVEMSRRRGEEPGDVKVRRRFRFDSAHSLPRYEGKCRELHGHAYELLVTVDRPVDDYSGLAIDFSDLKRVVRSEVVDKLDHRSINDVIDNPTAELMAHWIWARLVDALPGLVEVELYETRDCSVIYRGE